MRLYLCNSFQLYYSIKDQFNIIGAYHSYTIEWCNKQTIYIACRISPPAVFKFHVEKRRGCWRPKKKDMAICICTRAREASLALIHDMQELVSRTGQPLLLFIPSETKAGPQNYAGTYTMVHHRWRQTLSTYTRTVKRQLVACNRGGLVDSSIDSKPTTQILISAN